MSEISKDEAQLSDHEKLFGVIIQDGEKYDIPHNFDATGFDNFLKWGKERKVSDFSVRSNDYIRGYVGGGWRILSGRTVEHDEVDAIIRQIDTATSTADLLKGKDIDRAYRPKDMITKIVHRFRINMTGIKSPVSDSEAYAIIARMLPEMPPTTEQLGIEPELVHAFHKSNSISLITGGTGSGKSTLIYAFIRHFIELGKTQKTGLHILDYSKPIEYVINDIDSQSFLSQSEVGSMLRDFDSSLESAQWQYAVRNAMRRKPDVIVVGETRDKPTFDAVLTAANTGHDTITTLHNNSCASSLQRGLRFYAYEERLGVGTDLVGYLNCIINQQLVNGADSRKKFALREFIVMNDYVRNCLLSVPDVEKWPRLLQDIILDNSDKPVGTRKVFCRSKVDHAKERYNAGEISLETLEAIRAQTIGMESSLNDIGDQEIVDTTP